MSQKPLLVIQPRRLGDLILTFPLVLQLRRDYPANPIRIVAEPVFFQPLMPFSPNVVFFPPAHLPTLSKDAYELVINLGGTAHAAAIANIRASKVLGAVRDGVGEHIHGEWQLYRAALARNNRHNSFHWADLNRLDLGFPLMSHRRPIRRADGSGRIGLFVGASEASKRPDAIFWASLARRLAGAGLKPLLLGGPAEAGLGREISRHAGLDYANFCGRTSLKELAALIGTLDLFVTPDTGPMHLADWLGAPVLNLSMGNVHAPETGPVNPGQWVLRSTISCVGCWQCHWPKPRCKGAFDPGLVTRAISAILAGGPGDIKAPSLPGLELLRTGRDHLGLHNLAPVAPASERPSCGPLLDNFWKSVFLHFFEEHGDPQEAASAIQACRPGLGKAMANNFGKLIATFSHSYKTGQMPPDYWQTQPWHSRIFAGYLQMYLQNSDFSRVAWRTTLERLARLGELFAHAA